MSGSNDLISLRETRERAIARLSEAFAHGQIGIEELDGRPTSAHRATTIADVEHLVSDLVDDTPPIALKSEGSPPSGEDGVVAIFGGVERGGAWLPPRRLRVAAVFGGVVLDLREAKLSPGVTEIHVTAIFGGVQLIVPPQLAVDVSGTAVLGGFANLSGAPFPPDPRRPLLRVRGHATLGGVAVEVRRAGESERTAHRRRHALLALGPRK